MRAAENEFTSSVNYNSYSNIYKIKFRSKIYVFY